MSITSSTMSEMLTNMKNVLLLYQNTTLSKVKTWQRGVLSPAARYPALAILPISETFLYGFSNSKYETEKELIIEVYDIKLDVHQAHDNSVSIIEEIQDIFQDNSDISDSCYSSRWSMESYGDTIQINNGFLKMSSITFTGKSRESFPTMTTTGTTTNNVSTKDLQDKILAKLLAGKSANYSTVNTIVDSPVTPVPKLPAILIGAGDKVHNQDYPNADVGKVMFDITVASQLFAKETAMNHSLSITEGTKDVLQTEYNLDGYCDYSRITNIIYEQEKIPTGFIYSNNIRLECLVREFQ